MTDKLVSRSLGELAKVLAANPPAMDAAFKRVCIDSRQVAHGDLFVAIVGPNFDGHNFVKQALESGAVGAVVSRELADVQALIVVEDTRIALGQMATAWRRHCNAKVAAITGSNGKTTVKEMLAHILSAAGATMATEGNLNNDYGVPLSLLRIEEGDEFAVIEMGANHPGEIAYLTDLAEADAAVITNAGAAHLEGFGSIEGVAHAKGEIYAGIDENGTAVINRDDQYYDLWQSLNEHRQTLSFGLAAEADVRGIIDESGSDYTEFDLCWQGLQHRVRLPLLGDHNVQNALAASALALALGVDISLVTGQLETFSNVDGRLFIKSAYKGMRLIDDAYNANPDSMKAALAVLSRYDGRRVFVMGDMAETGVVAEQAHAALGLLAKEYGIDALFAVGELSQLAVKEYGAGAEHFVDVSALVEKLKTMADSELTVLVKGSRSAHMERVVSLLTEQKSAYVH